MPKKLFTKILNYLRNLPSLYKLVLAGFFTISVLLIINIINSLIFTPADIKIQNPITKETTTINTKQALNDLNQKLTKVNPENLIVEEVDLENLDVYPTPWVEKNFSEPERRNALISGPTADPDQDGLSNKSEYLYSSNPKNKYTLCGQKTNERPNCETTDKENLDKNISPLTGYEVQKLNKLRINTIDKAMIEEIDEAFTNSSKNGVDFPEVFQLSFNKDYTNELEKIQLPTVKDSRDSILIYFKDRSEFLKEFLEKDALGNFADIYKLVDVNSLIQLKDKYQKIKDKADKMPVPESFLNLQKSTVFSVDMIVKILEYRINTINNGTIQDEKVIADGKDLAIKMMWGFRKITEESKKIENQIQN
jgi:hypothetical protein